MRSELQSMFGSSYFQSERGYLRDLRYEDVVPSFIAALLLPHPLREPGKIPQPAEEALNILGGLDQVLEAHYFPAIGEGEVDQIWVAVQEVTPSAVRAVTDAISDVELEYDEIYDLHVVQGGESVPGGAQVFLIKK